MFSNLLSNFESSLAGTFLDVRSVSKPIEGTFLDVRSVSKPIEVTFSD